jgi:hypothetical protein
MASKSVKATITIDSLLALADQLTTQVHQFAALQQPQQQPQTEPVYVPSAKLKRPSFNSFNTAVRNYLAHNTTFDRAFINLVIAQMEHKTEQQNFRLGAKFSIRNEIQNDAERHLMLMVSKVYRARWMVKAGSYHSTLKSLIKYEQSCPECGIQAKQLLEHLKSTGVW